MISSSNSTAEELFQKLREHYPKAKMILEWSNNFELLIAIILSAQCTDVMVNKVTANVFPKYRIENRQFKKNYQQYAGSKLPKDQVIEIVNFTCYPISELEQDIKSTGFYRNKAKNVQAAAKKVLEIFNGVLPKTIDELITIPGVGRKTANVFLGNAYGIVEGIAVDTHVKKQSQLFGLTKNNEPNKIEQDLMKLYDKKKWFLLTYLLIEHGRTMRKKKDDRVKCKDNECIICLGK